MSWWIEYVDLVRGYSADSSHVGKLKARSSGALRGKEGAALQFALSGSCVRRLLVLKEARADATAKQGN
jgi:hypothetical protein